MHLFMAREAVDKHLAVAGDLIDPKKSGGQKLRALLKAAAFYALWYPLLWVGWSGWPRYRDYGPLASHLRFVRASSRKLARSIFHGMLVYRAGLEHRQGFLFRIVDVAMELFAMTAVVTRARALRNEGAADAEEAAELADCFCRTSRRVVAARFGALWHNDDARLYDLGRHVLEGRHTWLEGGIVGLARPQEDLMPTPRSREGREQVPEVGLVGGVAQQGR
jgi:hypothetical protein